MTWSLEEGLVYISYTLSLSHIHALSLSCDYLDSLFFSSMDAAALIAGSVDVVAVLFPSLLLIDFNNVIASSLSRFSLSPPCSDLLCLNQHHHTSCTIHFSLDPDVCYAFVEKKRHGRGCNLARV
jgi:hypothetical protein